MKDKRVKCESCKWEGVEYELAKSLAFSCGIEDIVEVCPECLSPRIIDIKDDFALV